ncbi:hypothetical protein GQ457_01G016010 [Hibiscus cannabinus]
MDCDLILWNPVLLSVLVSFGVGISSRSKDTILSFNMLFRVYLVLISHFAEMFWWHTLLGYFFQAGFRVLHFGIRDRFENSNCGVRR